MDRILHILSALLAGDHVSLQSVTYISELLSSTTCTSLLYECYFCKNVIISGMYMLSAARCTVLLHVSKRTNQQYCTYVLYCHIG